MKEVVLKYVLQNAIRYNGKANAGAVIGKILAENPNLKENIEELKEQVIDIIKDVNSLSFETQVEKLTKIAPELLEEKKKEEIKKLPDLPDVKNKVVMRLAPYPSGALHIGNAYPYIINDEYTKKYSGKLLLIIDDTIGSEEKTISKEAYKLIPEGLEWLNINFDKKIIYKSDRLNIYYEYAKELIKKSKAYVCFCDALKLRENRAKSIECSCRNNSVENNLAEFNNMLTKYKESQATLRLKTDMLHPNPAFRDRVLFRISEREHPKTGKKYKVWPLLEFSWAIDDHLLGITHVIRGKELMMESEMEKYIWDIFGWPHIVLLHSGLLQLAGVKISKSKSKKEVESGKYSGWDDPRTWSLQSLKRRGFKPEAIRNFFLNIGFTHSEITVPVDALYTENRRLIDENSNRYFFIENPKKINIKNAPKLNVKAPLHPDFPKKGFRNFSTSDEFYIQDNLEKNKVYRFMHLFNFKNTQFVSKEMDEKLNAKLIHWLPVSKDIVDVEILMDNGKTIKGLGESSLKNLKLNEIIQFERNFFAKLDKKEKNKLIFWFAHK